MRRTSALVLLLLLSGSAASAAEPRWDRVRVPPEAASGLDLEGARRLPDGSFEVVVEAGELRRLRAAGHPVEVLERDLVASFAARNAAANEPERLPGDPPHFTFGSMGGYLTLAEVVAQLDAMHAMHPELVGERFSIGRSVQGRDIWAVKLSDNPGQDEDEPEVMFNSLIHAREPSAMMAVLYYMWWLLDNHGTDPTATLLLDEREQFFVPVANPDGYEYNHEIAPDGGGMYRKNRRVGGGVDLNRNWGFNWGYDDYGSSPLTSSEVYRGPGPFSEPETQALRDFIVARPFVDVLHYHAHGRMYLHPYGHAEDVLPPEPDLSRYRRVLRAMAAHNGHRIGSGPDLLYVVNGDAVDWTYGEQSLKPKVYGASPEVGSSLDGFWPLRDRILPIARENLVPNQLWALAAGSYPEVVGQRYEEATGDGDGLVDPGEALRVWVELTLGGFGPALDDVRATIASGGSAAGASPEERPAGRLDVGETVEVGPFTVEVAADAASAALLPLSIDFTWAGGSGRSDLAIRVFGTTRVLVVEPRELSTRTGEQVLAGLQTVGVDALLVDELAAAPPLEAFDAVLVLLGSFPSIVTLPADGEIASALEAYLAGGGAVYLEGGDAWWESVAAGGHDFGPAFGTVAVAPSAGGMVSGVDTLAPWLERHLEYGGLGLKTDVLAAAEGAREVLRAQPQGFVCGVARRDPVTGARTVASSVQLGGLLESSPPGDVLLPVLEALRVRTRAGYPIAEVRRSVDPPASS